MSNRNDTNSIRLNDIQEAIWKTADELVANLVADELERLRIGPHLLSRLFDCGKKQQTKAWYPFFVIFCRLVDLGGRRLMKGYLAHEMA